MDSERDDLRRPRACGAADATSVEAGPRASLRHVLQALAGEAPRSCDRRGWLPRVRGLIAASRAELCREFERDGDAERFMNGWTHVADDVVIGALKLARGCAGGPAHGMVAPLAAVAVGGFGRGELAPASDLDLLFLLPGEPDEEARRERMIAYALAVLWDLGFEVGHAARTPRACLDLARDDASVATTLLDARPLWGRFSLYAVLASEIAAMCAREAMTGRLRAQLAASLHAAAQAEEPAEPHVKKGPGGLRDVQRLRWLARLRAAGVSPMPDPQLVVAHRFLAAERCHLHLLAGRAQERLTEPMLAGLAARMGLRDGDARVGLLARHRAHTIAVRELMAAA